MSVALRDVTQVEPASADLMRWLLREAMDRSPDVRLYRDFYLGIQPHALTETQLTILEGLIEAETGDTRSLRAKRVVDNLIRVIVDTYRGRLSIKQFVCDDAQVTEAVDEDVLLMGLMELQHDVHRDTARDGDCYVLLGWSNERGRVTLEPQAAWVADGDRDDSGTGFHLVYDDDGWPAVGIREWLWKPDPDTTLRRRTLYYPDRIERYARRLDAPADAWEQYVLEGESEWPAPWVNSRTREPLGIPVAHFRAEKDTAASRYGQSLISGSLIGQQRARNDLLHGLLASGRMNAYQMYKATGITEKDVEGWKLGPGNVLGSSMQTAQIDVLPAGNLEPLLSALNENERQMARNADIPLHVITGDWPSGEALLRAEIGLVARARVLQERFGRAWASALHKATILRNAFGGMDLNTEAPIRTEWDAAEMRDERWQIEMATLKAPFVSEREVLRMLDFDEDKITKLMAERAAEAAERAARAPVVATEQEGQRRDG